MILPVDPVRIRNQFAARRTALGRKDPIENNHPPLWGASCRNGFRIIPEVESIHVRVVEPQTIVMRMIRSLAWPRLERPAACKGDSIGIDNRIKYRLLQRRRPDIRSERLPVDCDVDTSIRRV